MKILHIIPGIEQDCGGPGKVAIALCQAISQLGFETDLVSTKDPLDRYNLIDFESIKNRVKLFNRWKQQHFAFSSALGQWFSHNLKQYDLVHIHSIFNYPSSAAAAYARKFNIPYLITPHGMLEPWALSYKSWKKRIVYDLIVKRELKQASTIQIIAEPEANSIKSLGIETPLTLIANGIQKQNFEKLPAPELFYQQFPATRGKTIIFFLGRIDPKKGLDLLAPAFATLNQQFPHTHLVIAGKATPYNLEFFDIVKEYFVRANCIEAVTFTGQLSGNIKYAALATADIYVSPSYSEGFSMSILEGMAAGLPCVITTGCNFPEAAARDAAYIVNTDPQEIARALSQCVSNPQQARHMGRRARQFIFENYTWEQLAKKLINVYELVKTK